MAVAPPNRANASLLNKTKYKNLVGALKAKIRQVVNLIFLAVDER